MTSLLDPIKPPFDDPLVAFFHTRYRNGGTTMPPCSWMGVPMQKTPTDLWIYQELIYNEQPDAIIELGTSSGGSALFLSDVLALSDKSGYGMVITVDWFEDLAHRPVQPRLYYVTGDTRHVETRAVVDKMLVDYTGKRMLILDASHDYQEVKAELDNWMSILREGDILIVEDTDLGGPAWGLELFQKDEANERTMVPMPECEKFMLTYNPGGYWRMTN